jgi:hypothetical protein
MLGDISSRETYTSSTTMSFFFHYYTIFVDVVLLNVLVAIISDTYAARVRTPRHRCVASWRT